MDKYEEALEKARAEYEKARKQGYTWLMDLLEGMFPEMKESEDERIRKELIQYLRDYPSILPRGFYSRDDFFAYLEKQKVQKPTHFELKAGNWYICHRAYCCRADSLTVKEGERFQCEKDGVVKGFVIKEPEKHFTECSAPAPMEDEQKEQKPVESCDGICCGDDRFKIIAEARKDIIEKTNIAENELSMELPLLDGILMRVWQVGWLNKKQKPAEWSEDWREEDVQTRFAFYTYKDDPSVLYLSNVFVEESSRNHGFGTRIIRAAEKVAEAIGATTISLKVKQNSPANAWYRKNGYGYVAFEDGYDWLEKNLEYMKPNRKI